MSRISYQPSAYGLQMVLLEVPSALAKGQEQIPRLSILINLELLNSTVRVAWP
ncbi:MAG: hypothetical protein F6K63_21990 [Moorea sp. SIO1G6]|uniref:Uncharacterized protein n=1 Tax=Moorena producens (strain JHB) TaxID=1454205 RepID=A0A9Q9UWC3_MOOP1|nr:MULTISPECIES: hypothetical protein [Moorena]NET66913.1 hypothetical protein [Moorena sp. SIO1G6]WAN69724.1 hypothetical protein BJP36_37150 [Moorena producens JHB]